MTTMNAFALGVLVGVSASLGIVGPLQAQGSPLPARAEAAATILDASGTNPVPASVDRELEGLSIRQTANAPPGLRPTAHSARLLAPPAPGVAPRPTPNATLAVQQRNRAGIPWIIAGAALIVGGAIVGDDAGTVLMVGGVLATSYGLFIYY